MLRKKYTITFDPWVGRNSTIVETRSIPWIIWLIDKWFLWAHEWPWLINKDWFIKSRWAKVFCTPYTYVSNWSFGFERIDKSEVH